MINNSLTRKSICVGVVGPCAAGKSTLVRALKERGCQAKTIAQEHSYVMDMWKRLTNPDFLIYLDVSYEVTLKRRSLDWTRAEYEQQVVRLENARENAHIIIQTDNLDPEQVLHCVLNYIGAYDDSDFIADE